MEKTYAKFHLTPKFKDFLTTTLYPSLQLEHYFSTIQMIKQEEWQRICQLLRNGLTVPKISKLVKKSTTTIYHLINSGGIEKFPQKEPNQFNDISFYKDYLSLRLFKDHVSNITKLFAEIKQSGYTGSYQQLYKYLKKSPDAPKPQNALRNTYKPSVRFETKPGEQAQVDWGSFGKIEINNKIEHLYSFVYVLGYSRALYIEFTIHQNLQTLQQCHIHAFKALGVPENILYDNMKTVVIKREKSSDEKEDIYLNPAFKDFADYYGFQIQVCPPNWPRAKGKVEAAVKYLRNNFMQGMSFNETFSSLDEINQMTTKWLDTIANVRHHKTTGKLPYDSWQYEKKYLKIINSFPDYNISPFLERNSTKDGFIQFKSNFYAIPIKYARRKLLVREVNKNGVPFIDIYYEDKVIATYLLSPEKGRWILSDKNLQKKSEVDQRQEKCRTRKETHKSSFFDKSARDIAFRPLSYYDKLFFGD